MALSDVLWLIIKEKVILSARLDSGKLVFVMELELLMKKLKLVASLRARKKR
jgi:hypothetical protein